MESYDVNGLVQRVKNVIDQNMESDGMEAFGDVDTLSMVQVLSENLLPAIRLIETNASPELLGDAKDVPLTMESCPFDDGGELVCKSGALPDDFMRFVAFRMSDWKKVVTEAITETSAMYAMQSSRVRAVRGNTQKPVVAIVHGPNGLVIEAYTTHTDSTVALAKYLPNPSISDDGRVMLCPLLVDAIVYATAYLVANSYNAINQAQIFLSTAVSLAGIRSAQQPTTDNQ